MAAGLVQSADAKFSWGCTWLSRPGEHYCATHSSICPPYPYLLGFAGTLGCSQQVVQGCPTLLSISRQFPPPLHPPLSQAWCKCISYLFWRYICFISYFFSNFRYWFCCRFLQSKCRGAVCVGTGKAVAEIESLAWGTAGTPLTQGGLRSCFGF